MAGLELSDSTAIVILASIAGVYFSITAACSVVICRLLCKKQCSLPSSSDISHKLSGSVAGNNSYELTNLRGPKRGIRDGSDLVPGGRAGRWRQYISSNQPPSNNGTSQQHNGGHRNGYAQEQPKLPAIEEVGAGGEEEEEEAETTNAIGTEDPAPRDSAQRSHWRAKRKVRGRTSSTKLLLEERDGSSWTLTSTNGANAVGVDELMSPVNLTASLPGSVLAQCGQSDTSPAPIGIPRPVPGASRIPGNTRSESPIVLQTSSGNNTPRLGQRARPEGEHTARDSPPYGKQRVRRTHRQLSLSTHSLPRQSVSTTQPLEAQISVGSGTLTQDGSLTNPGSRPKLRRYASTASYSSSIDPVVLVRPRSRSGSRRESYHSNTLGRTSFEQEQYCSVTSIEMEGNYYTLQTRRGVLEGVGDEARGSWVPPVKDSAVRSSREDMSGRESASEQCKPIMYRSFAPKTVIDLGHDGLESTV